MDDILGKTRPLTEQVDTKALAKVVLSSRVDESGCITNELPPELDDLRKKIVFASEDIITKNKRITLLATPSEELREIRQSLEGVVTIFSDASKQVEFDAKKFEYELVKAKTTLDDLLKKFTEFKQI